MLKAKYYGYLQTVGTIENGNTAVVHLFIIKNEIIMVTHLSDYVVNCHVSIGISLTLYRDSAIRIDYYSTAIVLYSIPCLPYMGNNYRA